MLTTNKFTLLFRQVYIIVQILHYCYLKKSSSSCYLKKSSASCLVHYCQMLQLLFFDFFYSFLMADNVLTHYD